MTDRAATDDVRVVVVGADAAARAGIGALLAVEPGIVVVGEADTTERALFETLAQRPDLVVLDLALLDASGARAIRAVREQGHAQVVVVSLRSDTRAVQAALDAGARGYVTKESSEGELVAAIRAVAAGSTYVDPALGGRLIEAGAAERRRAEEDPLSEREREVFRLLVLGHTNQEIARTLVLSVRTVETHRAHIMQKLRVSNRAELVQHALSRGVLADGSV